MTPVAKVRQAVMMTVSPSRWQAHSSVKGSLVVSRRDAMSWLARSEAEEGRRWRRADFKNKSGSETYNTKRNTYVEQKREDIQYVLFSLPNSIHKTISLMSPFLLRGKNRFFKFCMHTKHKVKLI